MWCHASRQGRRLSYLKTLVVARGGAARLLRFGERGIKLVEDGP
jgi:hypothetical protein